MFSKDVRIHKFYYVIKLFKCSKFSTIENIQAKDLLNLNLSLYIRLKLNVNVKYLGFNRNINKISKYPQI